MTNLAANLTDASGQYPDRPAVRLSDEVLSYADLDDRTARVAGWLRQRGLRPGGRVGIMLPNVLAFPVLYYGVLRAGGAVVPMNPLLKAREVRHYLSDSGAALVFAWDTAAGEAAAGAAAAAAGAETVTVTAGSLGEMESWPSSPEVADREDDDTAVILYTSGTTGTPKGAQLTHANMRANASVTATTLLDLSPDDVIMGCLPMFHAFGQTCGLNTAVLTGASITLVPRFDAATALKVIERDRVTVFEGVPTMYVAMLERGRRNRGYVHAAGLRVRRCGAAGRGAQGVRGGVRRAHHRGLRAVGDLPGRVVQPARRAPGRARSATRSTALT